MQYPRNKMGGQGFRITSNSLIPIGVDHDARLNARNIERNVRFFKAAIIYRYEK